MTILNMRGWTKTAPHTFVNLSGDKVVLLDNQNAIINGERFSGRHAIRAKRQELENK